MGGKGLWFILRSAAVINTLKLKQWAINSKILSLFVIEITNVINNIYIIILLLNNY